MHAGSFQKRVVYDSFFIDLEAHFLKLSDFTSDSLRSPACRHLRSRLFTTVIQVIRFRHGWSANEHYTGVMWACG